MNWQAARELAKNGLHIRRIAWDPNCWLIYQRGVAWYFDSTTWRVVTASDFTAVEFLADDWTQIPDALEDCAPEFPEPKPDPKPDPDLWNPDDPPGPDSPIPGPPIPKPDPNDPVNPIGPTPGPTPPVPHPPSPKPTACQIPKLSADALIYCRHYGGGDDEYRLSVAVDLIGGSGQWKVEARANGYTLDLGSFVSAPGRVQRERVFYCYDGQNIPVIVTATGRMDCSNQSVTVRTDVTCKCEDCEGDHVEYSEYHGWDECPTADTPCGSGPAACAETSIEHDLISRAFDNSCLLKGSPKADVVGFFDDYGHIGGIWCDRTSEGCYSCGVSGTVTPEIVDQGNGTFKLKVSAFAFNAPWGGPYSLDCAATFYFQ